MFSVNESIPILWTLYCCLSPKIEDKTLFLTSIDVGFSYDWLIPIGASTKREGGGNYAGYFGEGFKIASLCAIRDHGWNVAIRSRDWELMVVTTEIEVLPRVTLAVLPFFCRKACPCSLQAGSAKHVPR